MDIGIANCPKCGRVYRVNPRGVCNICLRDVEKELEKCKDYLRENADCVMEELSAVTEVSINQITRFINEGRISIEKNLNIVTACEVCGTLIREKSICDVCRRKLIKDIHKNENARSEGGIKEEEFRGGFRIGDRLKSHND